MPSGLEDVRMPMPDEPENKRALLISAHPDDSEFGAAGTVYQWVKKGWEFHYLICTDGSKGSEDPEWTVDKLVPTRREEQKAAAAVLGVTNVQFLDNVDGELTYNKDFMREVVRKIRTVKPYAVFGHDTGQIVRNAFINHPDHRAAGTVTLDAVYPLARNRPSFPELLDEGLEPFSAKEVYLWSATDTNYETDISECIEVKFEALSKHVTQIGDIEELKTRLKAFWREPDGRYVERFRRIALPF